MTKEDQADLILLISMFRSFNEQLYSLKGVHSGAVKQKFNRLIKVGRQYEREVLKLTNESKEFEFVYDTLMDILTEVKLQINERQID